MAWFDFLNPKTKINNGNEIADIFPLALAKSEFIHNDIISTYTKILTDTIDRTSGIPKKAEQYLWDNVTGDGNQHGLITMLAVAMAYKKDLYIVYKPGIEIIREATREEEKQIKEDYEKLGKSKTGVFVSFKHYKRTEMLEIWSAFEFCLLAGMNKQLNISKALLIKIDQLRSSVSLNDSDVATKQARDIASALGRGNDVLIDKNDSLELTSVNMDASKSSMDFLAQKKGWILSLPASYLTGDQTGGIGSTGENDSRAVENGLKQYFLSIIKPVCDLLFNVDCKFKSRDFRNMTTALEVLKTFDLVSDENISRTAKQEIVARVFDLDQDEEEKNIAREEKENAITVIPAVKTPPRIVANEA